MVEQYNGILEVVSSTFSLRPLLLLLLAGRRCCWCLQGMLISSFKFMPFIELTMIALVHLLLLLPITFTRLADEHLLVGGAKVTLVD